MFVVLLSTKIYMLNGEYIHGGITCSLFYHQRKFIMLNGEYIHGGIMCSLFYYQRKFY